MGESVTPAPQPGWYRDPPGGYEYGYWDGSAWWRDVTAAMHLMQKNSIAKFFIRGRALARIGEFVSNDETVECIGIGTYYSWGNRSVAVVLTDRRLLLLMGGRRSARVREYPLESISFAESRWWRLTAIANGKKLHVAEMHPRDRDAMAHAIQERLSGRRTGPVPPPHPVSRNLGKIRRWRGVEE